MQVNLNWEEGEGGCKACKGMRGGGRPKKESGDTIILAKFSKGSDTVFLGMPSTFAELAEINALRCLGRRGRPSHTEGH